MDYAIKFGDQLKQQLRSLRKARGLNQTELGVRLGVTQRRIAEIEANPGVVAIDQIIRMFSALGAELVMRDLSKPAFLPPPVPSSEAAADDAAAPHEFRVPLVVSARDLVADLHGHPRQSSAALLARDDALAALAPLRAGDKVRLIDALAKVLLVPPRFLEEHLATAAPSGSEGAAAPVAPIHDQWARALAVSPETLRQTVSAAIASRHAPVGLGTPPARGVW
jgi:HTH-type transcriptional regulator/antitoxin HipB